MVGPMSDPDYVSPELPFLGPDAQHQQWLSQLKALPSEEVNIREAAPTGADARRMWDLQAVCVPLVPQTLSKNVSSIEERLVLIAAIENVHVGFCIALINQIPSDPVFIQVVAVAPPLRRRGIGLALLATAAERAPERNVAMATQDINFPARAMNERFADTLNARIDRVRLGIYKDADLAIRRGQGYRPWLIQRR